LRHQTNTTQQSGREEHHYHETTNNAENATAAIPVHRSDRTLPQHLRRDTNLTGGKEETRERSRQTTNTTHTTSEPRNPAPRVLRDPPKWTHQTDDEEQETGRRKDGIHKRTYLLSYIWFATKENKWETKKTKKVMHLLKFWSCSWHVKDNVTGPMTCCGHQYGHLIWNIPHTPHHPGINNHISP
jgi:hypothetical protein